MNAKRLLICSLALLLTPIALLCLAAWLLADEIGWKIKCLRTPRPVEPWL